MAYHRDQWGNEVDEQGHLRSGVEAWAEHGIYPPPVCGDPHNPQIVATIRALRAGRLEEARDIADAMGVQHNITAALRTRASNSS